jgi:hypothetical protein
MRLVSTSLQPFVNRKHILLLFVHHLPLSVNSRWISFEEELLALFDLIDLLPFITLSMNQIHLDTSVLIA